MNTSKLSFSWASVAQWFVMAGVFLVSPLLLFPSKLCFENQKVSLACCYLSLGVCSGSGWLVNYLGFKWTLTSSKKRKAGDDLGKTELGVQVPQELGIKEFVRILGTPKRLRPQGRRWALRFRGASTAALHWALHHIISPSTFFLQTPPTCLCFAPLFSYRYYTKTSYFLIYGDLYLFIISFGDMCVCAPCLCFCKAK